MLYVQNVSRNKIISTHVEYILHVLNMTIILSEDVDTNAENIPQFLSQKKLFFNCGGRKILPKLDQISCLCGKALIKVQYNLFCDEMRFIDFPPKQNTKEKHCLLAQRDKTYFMSLF